MTNCVWFCNVNFPCPGCRRPPWRLAKLWKNAFFMGEELSLGWCENKNVFLFHIKKRFPTMWHSSALDHSPNTHLHCKIRIMIIKIALDFLTPDFREDMRVFPQTITSYSSSQDQHSYFCEKIAQIWTISPNRRIILKIQLCWFHWGFIFH